MSARSEHSANEFRVFLKYCRWSGGCSSAVAGVVFSVLFILNSLGGAAWESSALLSGTVAFCFLLVLFCCGMYGFERDDIPQRETRKRLMNEPSVSEEEFVRLRSSRNEAVLLEVRKRIARLFSVPVAKISRDVHLIDYIKWEECAAAASWIVFEKMKVSFQEAEEISNELDEAKSIDELTDRLVDLKRRYHLL